MLNRLQRVAMGLLPYKPVMSLVMLLALVVFVTELFAHLPGFADEVWLMPAGAGLLWTFFLWLFVTTGSGVPITLSSKAGWFKRLIFKLKRGYFYLVALFIVLGFIGITFVSLRFIRIALVN